jgi:phage terminase small subunit
VLEQAVEHEVEQAVGQMVEQLVEQAVTQALVLGQGAYDFASLVEVLAFPALVADFLAAGNVVLRGAKAVE